MSKPMDDPADARFTGSGNAASCWQDLPPDLGPEEQIVFLQRRASRAGKGRLAEILARTGGTDEGAPGDEVPEGWYDEQP